MRAGAGRALGGAEQAARWCQGAARGLVRFADAVLADLGRQVGHDRRAFQCTLLLAVLGRAAAFWLQVGDGDLVFETADGTLRAAVPGSRQEDADVTCSIGNARALPELPCGLLPAADLTGLAACSDGASERLVARDGQAIAPLLKRFLRELREERLSRAAALDFLRDRALWRETSRDDRSLALLARAG